MTPECKSQKLRRRFYSLSCFYFWVNFSDLEGLAMPQVSKSDKTFGVRLKAWFKTGKAGLLRNQVNSALNLLGLPSLETSVRFSVFSKILCRNKESSIVNCSISCTAPKSVFLKIMGGRDKDTISTQVDLFLFFSFHIPYGLQSSYLIHFCIMRYLDGRNTCHKIMNGRYTHKRYSSHNCHFLFSCLADFYRFAGSGSASKA
jgi:hypothetical protein